MICYNKKREQQFLLFMQDKYSGSDIACCGSDIARKHSMGKTHTCTQRNYSDPLRPFLMRCCCINKEIRGRFSCVSLQILMMVCHEWQGIWKKIKWEMISALISTSQSSGIKYQKIRFQFGDFFFFFNKGRKASLKPSYLIIFYLISLLTVCCQIFESCYSIIWASDLYKIIFS